MICCCFGWWFWVEGRQASIHTAMHTHRYGAENAEDTRASRGTSILFLCPSVRPSAIDVTHRRVRCPRNPPSTSDHRRRRRRP
uniref:Putative secreted protein n=1 Tax=Anopheles triannulatus TaxID=58253 RepID=A0A2M4B3P0_9DIPT